MRRSKRNSSDLKVISYYTGYIVVGSSLSMLIPMIVALLLNEYEPLMDFTISINIAFIVGFSLMAIGDNNKNNTYMEWKHGLVTASLSWLILTILAAIPLYLSGHMLSFLDAIFDVMSGFTTTGVFLIQDLDHISMSLNMWRHTITFLGSQGMVVLAITFLSKKTQGAYKMYVAEGKDIELLPNTHNTSKLIWIISLLFLCVGTFIIWINGMQIGLSPMRALYHGYCIISSAWSTSGFAPMSQNIMYYHSFSYEMIATIFLMLGSINFGLHYCIWRGNNSEIYKNIEVKTFLIIIFIAAFLLTKGLNNLNLYPDYMSTFRKNIFTLLSAYSTTGFMSSYTSQFANDWGDFNILILSIIMLIGGSACSTSGGFKMLRVAVVFKGFIASIKESLVSERRIKTFKFHHIKDHVLDSEIIKSSAIIILCYLVLFLGGILLACFYNYPLDQSVFESASMVGNVGLSVGITSPDMPIALKLYYIFVMYVARLEFMAVFVLMGYSFEGIKKICMK